MAKGPDPAGIDRDLRRRRLAVALTRAPWSASNLEGADAVQNRGISKVVRVMEAPPRKIVSHCNDQPCALAIKAAEGEDTFDCNAATGEPGRCAIRSVGDMVAMGVLDPTDFTCTALKQAVSLDSLMIATEAIVAELPKKEAAACYQRASTIVNRICQRRANAAGS